MVRSARVCSISAYNVYKATEMVLAEAYVHLKAGQTYRRALSRYLYTRFLQFYHSTLTSTHSCGTVLLDEINKR